MIRFVRIFTFLIAIVLLFGSLFSINVTKEMDLAYRAYRHMDMDQAMRHARRAALVAENNKKIKLNAMWLQTKIASKLHHEGNALKYLTQMIELSPKCSVCYLEKGDLEYSQGDYQRAVIDFSTGLAQPDKLSKKQIAYYSVRRGLTCLALGAIQKAETDVMTALRLDKDSPLAHFLKSKVLQAEGDIKGAAKEAKVAYLLGNKKRGFFSNKEGDNWLRYYSKVRVEAEHLDD